MSTHQANAEDHEELGGNGRSLGAGALLAAVAVGVAVGMLTAPEDGAHTRKRLRKRLSSVAKRGSSRLEDLGDGLGRRARSLRDGGEEMVEEMQERLEALEEQLSDAGREVVERVQDPFNRSRRRGRNRALGFALGSAVTYFLVSDRTAAMRARVQRAAKQAKQRATDEWEDFQQRRGDYRRVGDKIGNGGRRSGSATASSAGEATQPV